MFIIFPCSARCELRKSFFAKKWEDFFLESLGYILRIHSTFLKDNSTPEIGMIQYLLGTGIYKFVNM